MDAAVDAVTDWRAWLNFQIQFKQHADFVTMERTGENARRVLELLRSRLRSQHDVEVVDSAVESYLKCGGSLRGGIYKALEALTQRHCARGTRQKLQDDMERTRKHSDMTVEEYTAAFHHLVEMCNLLPLQDGPALNSAEVCRLYSMGMPSAWQDRMEADHAGLVTIGELEILYKRLEREERDEEAAFRGQKRRRCEDDSANRRGDGRPSSHHYDRRSASSGCGYCREHFYGHVYKTHTDEQCYRNPKSKNATWTLRYVPRGKCTAVFGPGVKKGDEECTESPSPSHSVGAGTATDTRPRAPIVTDKECTSTSQIDSKALKTDLQDTVEDTHDVVAPVDSVVKEEPDCEEDSTNQECPTEVTKSDLSKTISESVKPSRETAPTPPIPECGATKPWESVLLAMLGPFGQTDWCVLVLVDAATQIVELCPVVHATSEEITQAIDEAWLSRYPWPATFIYSGRVPAYDPTFSHLKGRCGAYSATPTAEPAPANMLSVLLLHLHLSIEMRAIEMQPQSHTDWINLVCVVRLDLRTNNLTTLVQANPTAATRSSETTNTKVPKQDPLAGSSCPVEGATQTPLFSDLPGTSVESCREFSPDDMVLVEYRETRRYLGRIPRREGPYRVEAVRTNGVLVIDKGKYLEHIHARRAILAGSRG